jgi:hypothetical protein
MKKAWTEPEITVLGVNETEYGPRDLLVIHLLVN